MSTTNPPPGAPKPDDHGGDRAQNDEPAEPAPSAGSTDGNVPPAALNS